MIKIPTVLSRDAAARFSVAVFVSAATVVCPETAIFLKIFCDEPLSVFARVIVRGSGVFTPNAAEPASVAFTLRPAVLATVIRPLLPGAVVLVIVIESSPAFVVIAILLPATNVSVSLFESATTVD